MATNATATAILFLLALLAGLALSACGTSPSSARGSDGCSEPTRDEFDPLSAQHVLPGTAVTYLTNPPTSGPHLAGFSASGLQTVALAPEAQVALLESGRVILHYSDQLDAADVERVAALAADEVIVMPAADPQTAPVVATAWLTRTECGEVDVGALNRFIEDHVFEAAGHG